MGSGSVESRRGTGGLTIGAFADVEEISGEPLIRSALGNAPLAPSIAHFRLAALDGVIAALNAVMIAKGPFSEAARYAADAFHGADEKTSAIRRTIVPLAHSALKEAYDTSRAGEEPPAPARRRVRPESRR